MKYDLYNSPQISLEGWKHPHLCRIFASMYGVIWDKDSFLTGKPFCTPIDRISLNQVVGSQLVYQEMVIFVDM